MRLLQLVNVEGQTVKSAELPFDAVEFPDAITWDGGIYIIRRIMAGKEGAVYRQVKPYEIKEMTGV